MNQIARAARAAERERVRQQAAALRAARFAESQRRADAKEAARLHVQHQTEEAERLTQELSAKIEALEGLLAAGIKRDPRIDVRALQRTYQAEAFDGTRWKIAESAPSRESFMPPPLTFLDLHWLFPYVRKKHELKIQEGEQKFKHATAEFEKRVANANASADNARKQHEARAAAARHKVEEYNAELEKLASSLDRADSPAAGEYFALVIGATPLPEEFPNAVQIASLPNSRHLIVEYLLPSIDAIPEVASYKYNRAQDKILSTARPEKQRKALYASLLAQIPLLLLSNIFRGGYATLVDCVTFNGILETIDPATGKDIRVCLLSVRATRDVIEAVNLNQVDPVACLKSLKASVSTKPDELLPVKPILEFNMVDPRFIEGEDVLSKLDSRTNLMELSPGEFEALITNLFAKMGLDTKLTQASRDGGVDCVAYDSRPILGGKVVIQAKRYKNTVGVSAVRDLFGTVQNEGASKGILVTTSGFGKASFDFANGKPLELLDGSNLLFLLEQHAGIQAKIVPPSDWKDAPAHVE